MKISRSDIIFYCCVGILAGFFISRGALSAAVIALVIVSFFHTGIKEQMNRFFSTPLLWGMSLLFLLPLISGLWSENREQWLEVVRIKLPLLFLPLAFASPFRLSVPQWQRLAIAFILLTTAGTLWSMFHYAGNAAAVNEGYLKAKSLITPLNNDHVRFSWMVAVAVVLCGWMYHTCRAIKYRKLLLVIAGWLVVYLHILAARTGLFSFYIAAVFTAGFLIFRRLKQRYALLLLSGVLLLPVIAYFVLPSFRNRVKYMQYDFGYFKDTHYLPGGNDAMRFISIKAGWNVMKDHPVAGTGFGDIKESAGEWYAEHYPEMKEEDKILPSSEWMLYGTGMGIPGLLLLTFILCIPFFTRVKEKLPWLILNCIAAFSFVADIGLEVQAGVCLYAFSVLCWWKWLSPEKV